MRPNGLLLAVALCFWTLPRASAQPSDDERARAHFLAGQSYLDQGRYAESAVQFDEGYRLSGRPQLLANAALAYERAGDLAHAIERLEAFLASEAPEATSQRATLTTRIDALRARLVAEQTETAEETPEVDEPTERPSVARSRRPLRIAGIAAGGAGVGAGAVSIVTGIVSHRVHEDLEGRCDSDGVCPGDTADDIDRGRRLSVISTATMGVAIAGIGAGVVMLVVGRDRDEAPAVLPAVSASREGVVVSIGGRL